ncbi:MAG: hypothetical protein SF097_13225 [Acidobacteriota bacterium]|nr:hypothetical protein [Acidobacteriota bacterium]
MEEQNKTELNWNLESAETAYSVIARYVEHTQISGILIAVLASALGEERVQPIVESGHWQSFMASKRELAESKKDIESLTVLIEKMRGEAR